MEINNFVPAAYTDEKDWYAVYTVVRHEKSVNEALVKKNIETFLPLRTVINQWKDRKKKVELPLFPGYLFVNTTKEERLAVLNAKGVVRMLGVNGMPIPIPCQQIEGIKKLVQSKFEYDPYPYLTEGKEVIVINGPLQGVQGKIIDKKGIHRLILSVEIIRRSISVEIDIKDVDLA